MRRRDWIYQALLLAALCSLLLLLVQTTQANLARLGVSSGLDFLWRRAGFEISQKLIDYDANSTIARAFLVALLNTLVLAAAASAGATLLGLLVGTARLSRNWLVAKLATAYVELFRNIPALLQIFFWYLVVLRSLPSFRDSLALAEHVFLNNRGLFFPSLALVGGAGWLLAGLVLGALAWFTLTRVAGQRSGRGGLLTRLAGPLLLAGCVWLFASLAGLQWQLEIPQPGRFGYTGGLVLMPEFLALVAGLSIYNASYISEIVRSGFLSLPIGQSEAAQALGLSRWQRFRLVLLPQALRAMLPPLTTVYLNLFKATSLAAAIAYPEVVSVFVGTVNNLVGQPVMIMAMTLAVYVLVSLLIAAVMNRYNRRIARTLG